MVHLTFTSAVRTWLPDRYAVEFSGQWEATEYKFLVTGAALEVLADVGTEFLVLDEKAALATFDENLGMLLPAAEAVWKSSDKMQREYVVDADHVREFQRTHPH